VNLDHAGSNPVVPPMRDPNVIRPELEQNNAAAWIADRALPYLNGIGLDIGCWDWKIKDDAIGVDIKPGKGVDKIITSWDTELDNQYDYVFSSHCLEHIVEWKETLRQWLRVIKPAVILFLYLPYSAQYARWLVAQMGGEHKHDFTLEMVLEELDKLPVTIVESGYDDFASFWICAKKNI
jgi:SAM-dependent methyltransferase